MEFLLQPWKHQLDTIKECENRNFYALFMEMGTGKTGTAINILRQKCLKEKKLLKTLILTPLITTSNWKKEFSMHSKIKDVVILEGSQKKRIQQIAEVGEKACVFISNHECMAVMKDLVAEFYKYKFDFLILDEAHRFKSGTSKRTKEMIKLSDTIQYKFILSGTPILNSPMDLFPQFRIMCGGWPEEYGFEKNFFAFRAKYFYDKNAGMPSHVHFPNWQIRPSSFEELNKKLYKHAVRVTKEECLDLPDEVEEIYEVELSDEQRKHYEEMREDFVTYIESEACVAQLAITKALRLQQIASGFIKLENGEVKKFKDTPRHEALKNFLENITSSAKVIVWAVFKENYEQIKEVCDELKLKYVEVHGDIPNAEKFKNVDAFNNNPDITVFIGHPGSGGIGINLVSATYSIFYSRNFSLGDFLQAKARNHRGGQLKKVTHIHISAKNTLDEQVTKMLANKIEISEKILFDYIKGMSNAKNNC